jgi:histidine ammonia-lyase
MIELGRPTLTLADITVISDGNANVQVSESCWKRVDASRQMLIEAIDRDQIVYGVTTGFGALASQRIDRTTARQLQVNLLRSHASGVGSPLPSRIVRVMLVLRAHALALGYSGVRRVVIERLLDLYHEDILPVVPSQGSVGASGDLAPLAHLALPLIGEGEVTVDGMQMPAIEALGQLGIEPLELEPKEALALINGTQAMTAIALLALEASQHLLHASLGAGAMSFVALAGRQESYDALINDVRPHQGQKDVAGYLRNLLEGWHDDPPFERPVQDRYSLRAIPQVVGAVLETLRFTRGVLSIEMNSATDNPLFFDAEQRILSGANFHGHPVALTSDHAKTAMASLTTYSERRIALMVDPRASNLPAFLAFEPGVNSGLMIPHYVAASIVSENKTLAHPASVDSLSTSADVEDYNSMGTLAARNLALVVENASKVIAIELICAAQAIDLRGIQPGTAPVFDCYRKIREHVPFIQEDQYGVGESIELIARMARSGAFTQTGNQSSRLFES